MFDRVQVRALSGSLKDIQRLILEPLLCCLDCVLRVIALLQGDPSFTPPQVLSALEMVFPSILTGLPVPAAEKHPQHDATTILLHSRDNARFLPEVMLAFRPKS